MKKKIISVVLALSMVLSLVPAVAFADYVSPIDQFFKEEDQFWLDRSSINHAFDEDAKVELGQLGGLYIAALDASKGTDYNVGVKAAYAEAALLMETNPKQATYIHYISYYFFDAVGYAFKKNDYALGAYIMTVFKETLDEIKLHPEKADWLSYITKAFIEGLFYIDYEYNDQEYLPKIQDKVHYAIALHATYLQVKELIERDPINADYLAMIGSDYLASEAWVVAEGDEALAAAIFALFSTFAADMKANPEDAEYIAYTAYYALASLDANGLVELATQIAKTGSIYAETRLAASKHPEIKKEIYYLGINCFMNFLWTHDSDYAYEKIALEYTALLALITEQPAFAEPIVYAGEELLESLAEIKAENLGDYLKQYAFYNAAFVEVLATLGINEAYIKKYNEKMDAIDASLAAYTDLDHSAWYMNAVTYCAKAGMKADSETVFGIKSSMTNKEVFELMSKIVDLKLLKLDRIDPNKNITKEDLAVMIYTYVKATTPKWKINQVTKDTNTLSYNDIFEVSEYASEAVHYCLAAGILQGDNHGNVFPGKTATKAEVAQVLYRFFN